MVYFIKHKVYFRYAFVAGAREHERIVEMSVTLCECWPSGAVLGSSLCGEVDALPIHCTLRRRTPTDMKRSSFQRGPHRSRGTKRSSSTRSPACSIRARRVTLARTNTGVCVSEAKHRQPLFSALSLKEFKQNNSVSQHTGSTQVRTGAC